MGERLVSWEEVSRRGKNHPNLLIDHVCQGWLKGYFKAFLGFAFEFSAYRQFDGARWLPAKETALLASKLEKQQENDSNYLDALAEKFDFAQNELKNFSRTLLSGYGQKNAEEIVTVFESFCSLQEKLQSIGYTYVFLNRFLPDRILESVAAVEKKPVRHAEIMEIFLGIDRPTETRLETLHLLEIAKKAEQFGLPSSQVAKMIEEHLQNFSHFGMYSYQGELFSSSDIVNRVKSLLEKTIEQRLEEKQALLGYLKNKEQTETLVKTLGLGKNVLKDIFVAKRWAFLANGWDESSIFSVAKSRPLLEEIARRIGISYSVLVQMTRAEIVQAIKQGLPSIVKAELESRVRNSVLLFSPAGGVKILAGDKLKQYYDSEQKQFQDFSGITELKGMCASVGHATGRVKVLSSLEELGKVQKGDILVAAATFPSFVPAMEKAAAIVTDEGGLLSHAAIVSRELKIPCIVGTKQATKVFRDNDLVEVDASRGVVRKLQ